MAYDQGNIFAKILRGELPCVKIFEDADTLAFMDIMPAVEGHVLVIPREAAETIFDLSPAAAAALIKTTKAVASAVMTALGCRGIMLAQLNGAAAGQTVPHIHFHVLPRTGGLSLDMHGREMRDASALEPIAARIRSAL